MNKRIETIPRETVDALCDYPWPGNVRELENFVERSVILSQSSDLQAPLGELKAPTSATSQSLNYSMTDSAPGPLSLEEMERKHIGEILERTKGVIGGKGGAAEVVGLPISTLRNRMKKLGMK
jgi:formate hydrogenlyase transcriptional activator